MSTDTRPPKIKRGASVELTLEKFADRGKSLARVDGYVVFVPRGVPGDRVRVGIRKRKRSYAEGVIEEVLTPSPLRTDPRCTYFGTCGGCKWQHVQYDAQLEAKRQSVAEAFAHAGGFEASTSGAVGINVLPTIGMETADGAAPFFYRNKMEFSFSARRWLTDWEIATGEQFDTSFALGLHAPGRFDAVLDLDACYLQSEWSSRLVNATRAFAKEHGWKPWAIRDHEGFLRHLVVRTPGNTDERMVVLTTNGHDAERMEAFAGMLRADFPETTTFVNAVNTGKAQVAFGEVYHTIFGPGVVHDTIGGYRFEIAPNAFFQTNTRQAERLYAVAADFADLTPDDLVYDLYSGAGTISIYLAEKVKHVVGVELIEAAVENAKANAKANEVKNVTFAQGDMRDLFAPAFIEAHGRPDVLIVDPPRAGLHPKVVEQLGKLRPERFVYVSCNPQSQARDLALLKDIYRVEQVQPVDLFPHTHHVEAVAKLQLR
ncbi:MAG: 23S rRNA (uracil(1939)-C(5))-methyltransferase RlmD [Bacteroidota bacterium]